MRLERAKETFLTEGECDNCGFVSPLKKKMHEVGGWELFEVLNAN